MLLVTLLLANMITNETLPVIMDPVLGGGIQSVVVSTALIVMCVFHFKVKTKLCFVGEHVREWQGVKTTIVYRIFKALNAFLLP